MIKKTAAEDLHDSVCQQQLGIDAEHPQVRKLLSPNPATMRKITAIALIAISTTLETGCGSKTLDSGNVPGLYEYDSGNRGTSTVCFVLSSDGTYAIGNASDPMKEILFSGTQSKGNWQLMGSSPDQKLQLGNSSFPIERTASGVRVIVDHDQDIYCDSAS